MILRSNERIRIRFCSVTHRHFRLNTSLAPGNCIEMSFNENYIVFGLWVEAAHGIWPDVPALRTSVYASRSSPGSLGQRVPAFYFEGRHCEIWMVLAACHTSSTAAWNSSGSRMEDGQERMEGQYGYKEKERGANASYVYLALDFGIVVRDDPGSEVLGCEKAPQLYKVVVRDLHPSFGETVYAVEDSVLLQIQNGQKGK